MISGVSNYQSFPKIRSYAWVPTHSNKANINLISD